MHALIALDDSVHSQSALHLLRALSIGGPKSATLIHVLEAEAPFASASLVVESERHQLDELDRVGSEHAGQLFENAAAELRADGWRVSQDIRRGDPADEITAAARQLDADLITVGALGTTGSRRFLLGGVVKRVIANAPCSVLVARPLPDPDRVRARILIGYDGSAGAEAAVATACELHLGDASDVTVATILTAAPNIYGLDLLERMSSTWQQHEKAAHAALAAVSEKLRETGSRVETRVLDRAASAADELIETAAVVDADLIVLGRSGHGRVREFLLGSVAGQVAEYGSCCVWIVKETPGDPS